MHVANFETQQVCSKNQAAAQADVRISVAHTSLVLANVRRARGHPGCTVRASCHNVCGQQVHWYLCKRAQPVCMQVCSRTD